MNSGFQTMLRNHWRRWLLLAGVSSLILLMAGTCPRGATESGFDPVVGPMPTPVVQGASGVATVYLIPVNGGYEKEVVVSYNHFANDALYDPSITVTTQRATPHNDVTPVSVPFQVASNAPLGLHRVVLSAVGDFDNDFDFSIYFTVQAAGSFTLSAPPSSTNIGIATGGTANIPIEIARDNFTGPVTLTATSAAGLTTNIVQNASGTGATVSITNSSTTQLADARVTIQGVSGSIVRTLPLGVYSAQSGRFSASVSPTPLQIAPGATGQANFTFTRNQLTDAIGFKSAIENDGVTDGVTPPGIAVSFAPASTTGNQQTATVSVGSAVQPGTYYLGLVPTAPYAGGDAFLKIIVGNSTSSSSYDLSVVTAPLNIELGSSKPDVVQINRNNYTAPVTVTGTADDAGITVTSDQPNGTTSGQVTLTVTVGNSVSLGTHIVTLKGVAAGLIDVPKTFAVVVGPKTGSYTFVTPATTPSVSANLPQNAVIGITRVNFALPISITGTSDAGITITPSEFPSPGNQTTLTIGVTSAVSLGTHTVTLKGVAAGLADYTTTFPITVIAQATNTTWTFCPSVGIPLFVAVQDGASTAPWTAVTSTGSNFGFNISNGTGGVAYVVNNGSLTELHVFYGSQSELQSQGSALCSGGVGATKTLNGSVTNTGAAATAQIGLGAAAKFLVLPTSTFQLTGVGPGPLDLIAATLDGSLPPNGLKVITRRNVTYADGSTISPLDFNAEGIAPATGTVLFTNSSGQQISYTQQYHTSNEALTTYSRESGSSANAGRTMFGIPTANQLLGDMHFISAQALTGTGSSTVYRTAGLMVGAVGNKGLTFLSALNTPTVTETSVTPYPLLRTTLASQADYTKLWQVDFDQASASGRFVTIQMTAGYRGTTGTVQMDIPNLSAAIGWSNNFALAVGGSTSWRVTASTWTGSGILFPAFVDGNTFNSATAQGTITP